MSKSKELDNILDECLERLMVKGETLEQCLRSFPEHADELKPLLEAVLVTSQVSALQPSPEFRDKARIQFYSALREMEHKKSRSFFSWGWQPRWATVVAIVLVLFLAGGGTVAAASGSMPDDLLYPVKLATEQVQLAFTFSTLGKAELHARLADKRVTEIVYLAEKSKPEKIELVANSLDNNLAEIAVLSSTQEVMRGVAMAPAVEEAEVAEEALTLEEATAVEEAEVAEEAPAAKEVAVAEKALTSKEATAVEEAPAAKEVAVPEKALTPEEATVVEEVPLLTERAGAGKKAVVKVDRRATLRAVVVRQANDNTARLRALLKTVKESARPALLRAITVSETGYEKALEALD